MALVTVAQAALMAAPWVDRSAAIPAWQEGGAWRWPWGLAGRREVALGPGLLEGPGGGPGAWQAGGRWPWGLAYWRDLEVALEGLGGGPGAWDTGGGPETLEAL